MRTIVALLFLASSCLAAEPVEIPLSEVWALDMPGTRNVEELEPDRFGDGVRLLSSAEQVRRQKGSWIYQIRQALPHVSIGSTHEPSPGFVVVAEGRDALAAAHQVFLDRAPRLKVIPARQLATIVFFAHQMGSPIGIRRIDDFGSEIRISYEVLTRDDQYMSEHFALIPISGRDPGNVTVCIEFVPPDAARLTGGETVESVSKTLARRVCKGFAFRVQPLRSEDKK